MKVKCDHRSIFSNLSNWKGEAWKKKSGLQRDLNPWPPRYWCDALSTELWSRTLWARSIYWVHIFPCSEIMWNIYEIIHICTAVVDESEVWSLQYIFQFKQLERRSLKKKIRASTGFKPMTCVILVRCSTNWAMKPHIGSKVNLLSSYLPVQWNHVKYIWNNSYLYCCCRWKWSVIIAVYFPI